jgi:MFS family permease
MDHSGAILGPVIATVFLYFVPGQYRLLFGLTAIPGALAVAMLFLVKEDAGAADPPAPSSDPVRPEPVHGSEPLPLRLYAVLTVILVFSLGNSADAFLLLRLGTVLGSATFVPLLWAALHVVKAGLSTWGGSLSDRVGRKQTIIVGWIVYAAVYLGFATAARPAAFIAWFLAYGVYFAMTEGAEKALVADLAPPRRHGTAFGLYNAALGVGALIASVAFGFIYDHYGASTAFGVGAALAGVAAVALLFVPSVNIVGSNAENSGDQ